MHECNAMQILETKRTKPKKPIYQTHQNINKTIFNNHISISQHIQKIQENWGLKVTCL